jgi:hypothetical protein
MNGFKLGWIIPIIMLSVLTFVIWVGIYQLNSDENPWYFGGNGIHGPGLDISGAE